MSTHPESEPPKRRPTDVHRGIKKPAKNWEGKMQADKRTRVIAWGYTEPQGTALVGRRDTRDRRSVVGKKAPT